MSSVIQCRVGQLTPHPKNAEIYGTDISKELIDSVRERGVLVPLLATKGLVVLAGNSRLHAAKEAGLKTVPVTVVDTDDPLDHVSILVHSNRQRVKTNSQMAAEAAALKDVEAERAEIRRLGNLKQNQEDDEISRGGTSATSGDSSGSEEKSKTRKTRKKSAPDEPEPASSAAGKTRQKLAAELGVGEKKAHWLAELGAFLRDLKDEGRDEDHDQLKKVLDSKSVKAAYDLLLKMRSGEPEEEPEEESPKVPKDDLGIPLPEDKLELFAVREKAAEARGLLRKAAELVNEICHHEGGRLYALSGHVVSVTDAGATKRGRESGEIDPESHVVRYRDKDLRATLDHLTDLVPYASVCPYCHDAGGERAECLCKSRGFIGRYQWRQAPEGMREKVLADHGVEK